MWLAWLLRSDVRGTHPVHDLDAQADYVTWWLLFGRQEYPAVWWYGPVQADVAMQPIRFATNVSLPRMLVRLYRARLDLQAAFDLTRPGSVLKLLCWYRIFGSRELPAAPALPVDYLALTEASRAGEPPPLALALLDTLPALQAICDPRHPGNRAGLARWFAAKGRDMIPPPSPLPTWPEILPILPQRTRPALSSFHLVGYTRAEFGIGEDVRAMSQALETAGQRHSIGTLAAGPAVGSNDTSRLHHVRPSGKRAATIFCITAFDTANLFLSKGLAPFQNTWNVGYWPWELDRFPDDWRCVYGLVDEVWAATRFQQAAYRANSPVPVRLMPPAVSLPAVPGRPGRLGAMRGSRSRRFRFLYPFDPKSFLARKNPVAAVRAFRAAFPPGDRGVELVLRSNGPGAGRAGWRALRAALAGDPRIKLQEVTLPRAAALAALRQADCLLSPHRAEGLGRNIAEAIALGTPVLATGPSGSADMLHRTERIPARPQQLAPGEYPHGDGLGWFEPDVRAMVRLMRTLRRRQASLCQTVFERRSRAFLLHFGSHAAGQRYADWLSGEPQ